MILKINPKHLFCLFSAKDTMEQPDSLEEGENNNGKGPKMPERQMKAWREQDDSDEDEQRPENNAAMREVMKCAKEV